VTNATYAYATKAVQQPNAPRWAGSPSTQIRRAWPNERRVDPPTGLEILTAATGAEADTLRERLLERGFYDARG